ncbi:MAG: protein kinase [Planctomycetes bacterium]|nr:protein kinase [Planctomycetota bacterium]
MSAGPRESDEGEGELSSRPDPTLDSKESPAPPGRPSRGPPPALDPDLNSTAWVEDATPIAPDLDSTAWDEDPPALDPDLNSTAWVEDAPAIAPAPHPDATRWEMEVPSLPEEEGGFNASEDTGTAWGPSPAIADAGTGAWKPAPPEEGQTANSGSWDRPGGPPPGVAPVSGPSHLGVDPREELSDRLKMLWRRFPSFAPHSGFAFERLEELGRGGMGVVYRVRDKRLGRHVALKVLQVNARASADRFRREIEITAKLDHPGVPAVYEAGTTATGEQYLLLRLIHGVELKDRIEAYHAADRPTEVLRELLEHLLRLGETMAYAHKKGVVHRDLKPENVMVGRFGELFVLDWGLARILEEDADDSLHHLELETASYFEHIDGSVVGTPGYMPPEQARGEEVDTRADVFALGAILSTILTGQPPVAQGKGSSQQLAATIQGEIVLPRARRKDVSTELNALAAACLAPDASDRLGDASAFVRELHAYLAGDPLSVHRYSLSEQIVRSARRQPGLLIGILLVLLLCGGASLIGLLALRTENAQAARERSGQESKFKAQLAEIRQHEAQEHEAEIKQRRLRIEDALELMDEATGLATEGEADLVDTQIRAALELDSSRFLLWAGSDLYARAGSLSPAIALLERSAQEYPPGYRALYRVHHLLQRKHGSSADSETPALRRILELAKDRGDANEFTHLAQGLRARQRRDWPRAEASFEAALELAPRLPEARFEHGRIKGILSERKGDWVAAEAGYSKAIRAQPARPAGWTRRARVRIKNKAWAAAVADAKEVARLEPASADAHALLAWALSFEGEIPEAIQAHQTALLREGTHPMALAARGQVQRRQGELAGAKKDWKAALEQNPDAELQAWLEQQLKP